MSKSFCIVNRLFVFVFVLTVGVLSAATEPASSEIVKLVIVDSSQAKSKADSVQVKVAVTTDSLAVKKDTVTLATPVADSAKAKIDSITVPATVAKTDSTPPVAPIKKRPRIVRETTVNSIDQVKGQYRSPKKALFMSFLIPGLGEAYVGHYTRGAAFFLADVGLLVGWHHFVVTRYNQQVKKYQVFADSNWSLTRYEDSLFKTGMSKKSYFDSLNSHRENFCNSIKIGASEQFLDGCKDPNLGAAYDTYINEYNDAGLSAKKIGENRSHFADTHDFYELIGKQQEFIAGWSDVREFSFSADGIVGSSNNQQDYVAMRSKASEYSRMQAWFLGGLVLNHIVSAIDAGLLAHYHNKSLYQTDVAWYDKIRLDSFFGWENGLPKPMVTAYIHF